MLSSKFCFDGKHTTRHEGCIAHTVGGSLGCGCWRRLATARAGGQHLPWWTAAFTLACVGAFLYMAG